MPSSPNLPLTEEEHKAEKSEPLRTIPREEWPDHYTVGSGLNWKSPLVPVMLYVELPFWILSPAAEFSVKVQETTLQLAIAHDGVEVVFDNRFRSSHSTTEYFTPSTEEFRNTLKSWIDNPTLALTYRTMRTVAIIKTMALQDAILADSEDDERRKQAAYIYFQSLVSAHLPFVNRFLNAYRDASNDPFTFEVSEWDLPFWRIGIGDKQIGVHVCPYASSDQYPYTVNATDGTRSPMVFAAQQEVESCLKKAALPGNVELLDAWNLFYRGRYADAIRLLVTAIEVLLEHKFKETLFKKGLTEEQIEKRLEKSWNNFEVRLADYLAASQRTLPGPILSFIPYINGVRFKTELDTTRNLRHKVVHEGLRFDPSMAGPMLRAVETTTWLFDWLGDETEQRERRFKLYSLKSGMRGKPIFPSSYTKEAVVVHSLDELPGMNLRNGDLAPFLSENILHDQFCAAIDPNTRDVDLFVRMFLTKIGFSSIDDAFQPSNESSSCSSERYIVREENSDPIYVFIFDVNALPTVSMIQSVATRMLSKVIAGQPALTTICVFNHQNGAPWQLRERNPFSEQVVNLADQCGLILVSTIDIILLGDAIHRLSWPTPPVKEAIVKRGCPLAIPPGCRPVGHVCHFYAGKHAMSVLIDGDAEIHAGDRLVVELKAHYHEQTIESLHHNREQVQMVGGGKKAGVGTSLQRSQVPDGAKVYLR